MIFNLSPCLNGTQQSHRNADQASVPSARLTPKHYAHSENHRPRLNSLTTPRKTITSIRHHNLHPNRRPSSQRRRLAGTLEINGSETACVDAPMNASPFFVTIGHMIGSRQMSFWPRSDVRPSRSLPPLERWRGVRQIQAAKSRPFENVSIGGANVVIAAAVIGPTPGIVARCRAASSWVARRRSFASSSVIFSA